MNWRELKVILFIDGKFQWIAVTAVVAIFSFLFTAIDNRRNLNSDLISKTRIQWLNDTRELIAKYIKYQSDYMKQISDIAVKLDQQVRILNTKIDISSKELDEMEGEISKGWKEADILKSKLQYFDTRIKLQFSENSYNNVFLNKFNELVKRANKLIDDINKVGESNDEKIDKLKNERDILLKFVDGELKLIIECTTISKKYFGLEWKKAKRGK